MYRALYNTPIHYTHFILSADIHVMMYTYVMCYELCVYVYVLVPPCKTPINHPSTPEGVSIRGFMPDTEYKFTITNIGLYILPFSFRCIDPWVHA